MPAVRRVGRVTPPNEGTSPATGPAWAHGVATYAGPDDDAAVLDAWFPAPALGDHDEAVDRVMRGEGAPSPIYEGEDSVVAWMLDGPQAHYVVPLPAPGEAKRAILDSYTKEHSAEYQSQALIDLAFRMREQISDFDDIPKGERYIFNGTPFPQNLTEVQQSVLGPAGTVPESQSYTYHLSSQEAMQVPGGSVKVVDPTVFPLAQNFSAALITIEPGAMREIHWHLSSDEWNFFLSGRARLTSCRVPARLRTRPARPPPDRAVRRRCTSRPARSRFPAERSRRARA